MKALFTDQAIPHNVNFLVQMYLYQFTHDEDGDIKQQVEKVTKTTEDIIFKMVLCDYLRSQPRLGLEEFELAVNTLVEIQETQERHAAELRELLDIIDSSATTRDFNEIVKRLNL